MLAATGSGYLFPSRLHANPHLSTPAMLRSILTSGMSFSLLNAGGIRPRSNVGDTQRTPAVGGSSCPPRLRSWYGGLGASPYFAALAKGNGRIDDHQVALFDPIVYFHLRSQIARHRHLVDMRPTVLD